MPRSLVLDSEALNALAHPKERGATAQRARACLMAAQETDAPIVIPAVVLAEVIRDKPEDVQLRRLLKQLQAVEDVTEAIALQAGTLLRRSNMDSRNAVDAMVVATALSVGPSLIPTSDPKDLRALAAGEGSVEILALAD